MDDRGLLDSIDLEILRQLERPPIERRIPGRGGSVVYDRHYAELKNAGYIRLHRAVAGASSFSDYWELTKKGRERGEAASHSASWGRARQAKSGPVWLHTPRWYSLSTPAEAEAVAALIRRKYGDIVVVRDRRIQTDISQSGVQEEIEIVRRRAGAARVTRSPRGSSFKVIHDPGEAFAYVNRLGFAPSGPIGYRQHDLGVVVDKLLEASGQTTWYHKEFRSFKVRFQNYIAEGTGYRYPWLGQFIVIGPDEQVRVLEMKGVKTH